MKSDLRLIMENWRRFLKEDSEAQSEDETSDDFIDPGHYDPEYGEPEGVTPKDDDLLDVEDGEYVSIEDKDDK